MTVSKSRHFFCDSFFQIILFSLQQIIILRLYQKCRNLCLVKKQKCGENDEKNDDQNSDSKDQDKKDQNKEVLR